LRQKSKRSSKSGDQARLAKNWRASDQLRDELSARGWEVRDTKDGQKITRRAASSPEEFSRLLSFSARTHGAFQAVRKSTLRLGGVETGRELSPVSPKTGRPRTAHGQNLLSQTVFVGARNNHRTRRRAQRAAWIGENCHIRSGCYVRENVIVGDGVVMGNSCEFKNCIIFDEAQIPHFNYVGDSILGYRAHLGAGVILSNVKLNHLEITVAGPNGPIATGLTKFGRLWATGPKSDATP